MPAVVMETLEKVATPFEGVAETVLVPVLAQVPDESVSTTAVV